ncbi:hypothetical protein BW12_09125 [Bifidobacterium sp. UTCIF-3]|nr:hypothetical protein BW09_07055 [Bifidobacterium sp. UTCIF-1]TPF79786.1 hypothetical protein BW08_08030 [Bifidobacterium sp. UTCIF-24]TPF81622.1 hypothetical protein BW12_09125 [Bifidobacterium sp. UTCIF-3]TPF84821.1 hypothetical protein BW07_02210 [Bifidobacterium sp. UTCIF-36]TPF88903.1 hypothetical protein BW10_08430 [Bifidobacterium sp. UTBIF-56]
MCFRDNLIALSDVGGLLKTAVFRRLSVGSPGELMAFLCWLRPCSPQTAVRSYRDKKTRPAGIFDVVSRYQGRFSCPADMLGSAIELWGRCLVFTLSGPFARLLLFAL